MMVGWQEAHKNTIPLILRGSLLAKVEHEDTTGSWLTQVHMEKWPLKGSSSSGGMVVQRV